MRAELLVRSAHRVYEYDHRVDRLGLDVVGRHLQLVERGVRFVGRALRTRRSSYSQRTWYSQ
jgi:hypothetical protein